MTVKPDELAMMRVALERHSLPSEPLERFGDRIQGILSGNPLPPSRPMMDAACAAFMHPKRVHAILLKWDSKGWWDYGVSARTGWLTEEGVAALLSALPPKASP